MILSLLSCCCCSPTHAHTLVFLPFPFPLSLRPSFLTLPPPAFFFSPLFPEQFILHYHQVISPWSRPSSSTYTSGLVNLLCHEHLVACSSYPSLAVFRQRPSGAHSTGHLHPSAIPTLPCCEQSASSLRAAPSSNLFANGNRHRDDKRLRQPRRRTFCSNY